MLRNVLKKQIHKKCPLLKRFIQPAITGLFRFFTLKEVFSYICDICYTVYRCLFLQIHSLYHVTGNMIDF